MAAPPGPVSHRELRRRRWQLRQRRFLRLWRIYYRSNYGKIGFWILVVFAGITLLSPLLTFHDPNYFFAPPEDAYALSQELAAPLGFSVVSNGSTLPLSAVAPTVSGSSVVYATSSNGTIVAIGLGATPSTPAGKLLPAFDPRLPAGAIVVGSSVLPLADFATFNSSYIFVYDEYALEGVNVGGLGELEFARIAWSGTNGPGDGTPHAANVENLTLNGPLVLPPSINTLPLAELPAWGSFADSRSYGVAGLKPALITTVTRSNGTYWLSGYDAVPLQLLWREKLPGTGLPSVPVHVGDFFAPPDGTSRAELLVAQDESLLCYNPYNGQMRWESNMSSPIDSSIAPVVPVDYQLQRLNGTDDAFIALAAPTDALIAVALGNGTSHVVSAFPEPIEGIGTTLGDTGYPTYTAVLTPSFAYFLVGPLASANGSNRYALPGNFGPSHFDPIYDSDSELMLVTGDTGTTIAVDPGLGQYATHWEIALDPVPHAVSAPILLDNKAAGKLAVGFTTSSGEVDIYAAVGVDRNPLPPTLHSPSGNAYLFGTNTYGQDVFSQFIASFAWDWAVGLAVAAGIMVLAVLVAMYIGYVGSWLASIVETLTLVLFLLPGLAFLIVVASILGASFTNIVLVLTVVGWPFTCFTLIGVVRSVRSRTFVEAARVSGAGTLQILRRHMLPNMTPLLAYLTALSIGGAATALSTLQFIGLAPLTIPTWGGMLYPVYTNYDLAFQAPWWIWPPTIALTLFVFAFVFVSRGLDAVVNPRLRSR